jgi:hypothetical protein
MAKTRIASKRIASKTCPLRMARGSRYGRLTAVVFKYRKGKDRYWLFRCDCGGSTVTCERTVRRGQSQSCGCRTIEANIRRSTHGMCRHKLYGVYKHMINRCHDEKDPAYGNYGGRGIKVCREWRMNRSSFFVWSITNGYAPGLQIDRENNNKGYSPANCRWGTREVNANNTRKTLFLTWNGETLSFRQWSRKLGFNKHLVYSRISSGWTTEEALATPVRKR